MTVDLPIGILRGLSTDTKPTSVNHGTLFFETDTGKTFYWNSNISEWIEQTDEKRWQVLGVGKLFTDSASLIVQNLKPRKYLRVIIYPVPNASVAAHAIRLNNNAGANYATRQSINGGADTTSVSVTSIGTTADAITPNIVIIDILNLLNQEKLLIIHVVGQETAGAANVPDRRETVAKLVLVEKINRIDLITGAGSYLVGTTMIVQGHD